MSAARFFFVLILKEPLSRRPNARITGYQKN